MCMLTMATKEMKRLMHWLRKLRANITRLRLVEQERKLQVKKREDELEVYTLNEVLLQKLLAGTRK